MKIFYIKADLNMKGALLVKCRELWRKACRFGRHEIHRNKFDREWGSLEEVPDHMALTLLRARLSEYVNAKRDFAKAQTHPEV